MPKVNSSVLLMPNFSKALSVPEISFVISRLTSVGLTNSFEILTLKQLARHNKPMAIFNIDGYYDKLEDFMQYSIDQGFMTSECKKLYICEKDAKKIAQYLEEDKAIAHELKDLKRG